MKLSISLDEKFKISYSLFYRMPSWGLSNDIETKLQATYFYLIKLFQKAKRGLELVSLPHFLDNIWRKICLSLFSIKWPNFIFWLLLLRKMFGKIYIVIVYWPGCNVINYEINLIVLIKPFFLHNQKVKIKI